MHELHALETTPVISGPTRERRGEGAQRRALVLAIERALGRRRDGPLQQWLQRLLVALWH